MLTRAEACILADLNVNTFKALALRGHLPEVSEEAEGHGHKRYPGSQIFNIGVMAELQAFGVAPAVAAEIASQVMGRADVRGLSADLAATKRDKHLWVGVLKTGSELSLVASPDGRIGLKGGRYRVGHLVDVAEEIEAEEDLASRRESPRPPAAGLILVNASAIFAKMSARARKHGGDDLLNRFSSDVLGQ